ncbi:MAG: hypothetical protein JWN86_1988 [Planctomycetota bacterium]|nr:hypothetical protein [Planctomycetota bacterium]
MSESPSRKRYAVPGGLLGMIGLVLVIELTLTRHELDFTNFVTWSWKHAGRAVSQRATKTEIFLFGDSLVKFGVAPRVMEPILKKPTYNFAVFAGRLPVDYFLLKRALDAGARPSAVVFECEQYYLTQPPMLKEGSIWPDLLTQRECLELARSMGNLDFFTQTTIARILFSYKAHGAIRGGILAALRGEKASTRDRMDLNNRNWDWNLGAQIMPKGPLLDPAAIDNIYPEFFPKSWAIDPVNASYLRKFLRLVEGRGIPVFWLVPPISPPAQARRQQIGMDALYTELIRSMQERSPSLIVIDGRRSNYSADAFLDPFHLNGPAAAVFSQDVATLIAASLKAGDRDSRWFDLPAYHDRPADDRVEDIVRSQLVLDKQKLIRR